MNTEIECPYCYHDFDLNHDDGAYYDQGRREEAECPECEKVFMVSSSMHWSYEGEKADCLNDGEHEWEPVKGSPREYFHETYRCNGCDEEECRDVEGRNKLMKEKFS